MAGKKNRTQLQALFKTGAKPSEEDFRGFIDSVLNINDDGIEKPPGVDTPLKILARGDAENLLDCYAGDLNTWRLNQKPTGANPGLNVETGGISKLFLESSTGNLGLSTTQPTAKLHIQQSGSQDALRIDDEAKDTTPLIIDADGKVGIGKAIPATLLDVNGDTAIARSLSVGQTSTLTGNVGIGTAPGGEALKLNVAGNAAFSGTLSVTQTSYLKGNVGIGTAPSTETLKVSGTLSVSQESTLTGNVGIGTGANAAHKLTVCGGELALKVDNNENAQSILFQNSGGSYVWRIYRENIGDNKADLKIAGGATSDYTALTDYVRIQNNGNATFSGNLSVAGTGTSSFAGSVELSGKLTIPGAQKIVFADNNLSNNLKLQLWDGYGLGINNSTLFYAANGKHSWRDKNGANERMVLTTTADGELTVKGTGTSSFAGNLSVGGTTTTKAAIVGAFNLTSHINVDGAFYRKSGQTYIAVDDNFYIRDAANANNNIRFHFDTNSGSLGIGMTNPSKGKVQIQGYKETAKFGYGYLNRNSPTGKTSNTDGTNVYSLYANERIAASEFNAHSDVRIKQVKGRSNSQKDLQILQKLAITDYTLKDTIAHNNRPNKKVLGQQVAQVFPQAVSTHTDVVPDIFQPASISEGWVHLSGYDLKVGERIQLFVENQPPTIYTIEAITPDRFQISLDYEGAVFVYGREVDDFHVVDYNELAMLHISATQELCTIIDTLKCEVQYLKTHLITPQEIHQ
ncbi:hypothetical protein IQ249_10855 [Lusitaniella coriacea LEGE 07157]|uniref:Peptidase S74 domain-containing protein n=1 Tax=Lusitaniella coriacea LEGE 07157 TaxID=945747 RepID=A0A8J7IUA8_9CYAN|nr:hypothetical protein [Lusitaniella coriacea]MBE9116398.1 hypothetical protein [Lusitaniella coriacea LEGE 07157]